MHQPTGATRNENPQRLLPVGLNAIVVRFILLFSIVLLFEPFVLWHLNNVDRAMTGGLGEVDGTNGKTNAYPEYIVSI